MKEIAVLLFFLCGAVLALQAQTLQKQVISNGGGKMISAENAARVTVGQPIAGPVRVDSTLMQLGYWHFRMAEQGDSLLATTRQQINYPVMSQNYPNPFQTRTTFDLYVPREEDIKVSIFHISGQLIGIVLNRRLPPGKYSLTWEASEVPPGQYTCRLEAGNFETTRKLILVR